MNKTGTASIWQKYLRIREVNVFMALVVLIIIMSAASPYFLKQDNRRRRRRAVSGCMLGIRRAYNADVIRNTYCGFETDGKTARDEKHRRRAFNNHCGGNNRRIHRAYGNRCYNIV